MTRRCRFCLLLVCALAAFFGEARGAAAGAWVSVRSENFTFVGHTGERELRELTSALEEFRTVFRQLLPKDYFDAAQPLIVLVFADDGEYAPFKPQHEGQPDAFVAGYFKAGQDLNYITLAARGTHADTTAVLFHEYVHALVRNRYGRAPVWLDEGLAEYYSEYTLVGGKKVRYGEPVARRAQYLRGRALLPLATLLTADHYSPLYGDHSERGIFYAQSWALVHYLLSDRTGERERHLANYLQLTGGGTNFEDALRQSFQLSSSQLESRLVQYIRAGSYEGRAASLGAEVVTPAVPQAQAMSDAATQARLGDLLLRTDRPEQAEAYLTRSLALDAELAPARVTLGLLRLQQGRAEEAKEQLRRATELAPGDALAHYYYAGVLDREGSEAEFTVAGFTARSALIRAELKRAVELAPDFIDAQALLVLTDIERSPSLDEAMSLLGKLTGLAPARREFALLRARLDLRRAEFDAARTRLRALSDDPFAAPFIRHEAQRVLDTVPRLETLAAERQKESGGEESRARAPTVTQPCDMPEPGPELKSKRFAGEQACGRLLVIECEGAGVRLFVKTGERTLRLRAATLGAVKFITYTSGVRGKIECGARPTPELVLVTFKPLTGDADDGELRAVEFVPEDWVRPAA